MGQSSLCHRLKLWVTNDDLSNHAVGNAEYVVTFIGIDSNGDNSIFVQKFIADGTPKFDPVARSAVKRNSIQ